MMTPTKRIGIAVSLWTAYGLVLVASISHVAWAFNTLERPGDTWAGWAAAVAVDFGLAALAYAIQQRRRAKRPVRALWAGVAALTAISGYANTLHALSVAPGDLWRAVILSATLPILIVYFGEIISSDDAAAADALERAQRRAEAAQERELSRLAQADNPVPSPVTAVTVPVSDVAQAMTAPEYAAANGVSLRTAYRHLGRAGVNGHNGR